MSDMPKLVVLRTLPENLDGVIQTSKHALDVRLTAQQGDILLIGHSGRVTHAMRLRCQRPDTSGETEVIGGRRWRFIIDGDELCQLVRPFSPQRERVTDVGRKNYGPCFALFYVLDDDARAFRDGGLLRPILPPLHPN